MECLLTEKREAQIKRLFDFHPDEVLTADALREFIDRRPFHQRERMRRTLGNFLIQILE